jgi:hypothetical protein
VVSAILNGDLGIEGPVFFKDDEHDTWYPADAWKSATGETEICMIIPNIDAGLSLDLMLDEQGPEDKDTILANLPVRIEKKYDTQLDIYVQNEPLTSLHYNEPDADRPYLYPLAGPQGQGMTRNFPMQEVEGETFDHPHHRSVWTAYGEVSGVDQWATGGMVGKISVTDIPIMTSGLVCGRIVFNAQWRNKFGDEEESLDETREIRVYNLPRGEQSIDFSVSLSANHGDVFFGDTKEGGLLAVRVATSMDGDKGGLIENANGDKKEKRTWGKSAPWCDYSGKVEGYAVGLAIMNHPTSFRFPTYWHVRDYGLFAANPFGLKAFTNGKLKGEYTLKDGSSITFKYRLLVHEGGVKEGNVTGQYTNYATPPMLNQV